MKTIVEQIRFLYSILELNCSERIKLIKEFQNGIWNSKYIQDEKINEILSELAYDMDFYEPNEEWRKESPSYYGDDRLKKEIEKAIQKLENYKKSLIAK